MKESKQDQQEACRPVRRQMGRHKVDSGEVQVSCSHGTIQLFGRIRPLRGHEATFEQEVAQLLQSLRHQPGIHDVIAEWRLVY